MVWDDGYHGSTPEIEQVSMESKLIIAAAEGMPMQPSTSSAWMGAMGEVDDAVSMSSFGMAQSMDDNPGTSISESTPTDVSAYAKTKASRNKMSSKMP